MTSTEGLDDPAITDKLVVAGHTFVLRDGEEEPRVLDLHLAEWLGAFTRPRDIRKLIVRLLEGGILNDSETRATVARVGPVGRERDGTVYWLSESGALKVAARSEGPRASAVLDEVIQTYIELRRVRVPVGMAARSVAPLLDTMGETRAAAAMRLIAAGGAEADVALLVGTRATVGQTSESFAIPAPRRAAVLEAVIAFMKERASWSGEPAELLAALNRGRTSPVVARPADLGRALNAVRELLAEAGVVATAHRGPGGARRRTWRLVRR